MHLFFYQIKLQKDNTPDSVLMHCAKEKNGRKKSPKSLMATLAVGESCFVAGVTYLQISTRLNY